jgi:signal peptidase II
MYYFIILVVFALDQISKYYIQNTPSLHSHIEIIKNFLYINYVKNTGVAWSMLSGKTVFLIVVGIVETIILIYFFIKMLKAKNKPYCIALSLMIGGALGNLFDRCMFGYVRDFIDTYIFGYDFPVFNIADSALCIGVAIIIILMFIEERNEKKNV